MKFKLKEIRLKSKKTQKDVAEYLMISPQSISKWERGECLPSIEYLPELAEFFNCEIGDFFPKRCVVKTDINNNPKWVFSCTSFENFVVSAFKRGYAGRLMKIVIEETETLVPFLRLLSSYLIDINVLPIKKLQDDLDLEEKLAESVQKGLCLMGIMTKDENGYPMDIVPERAYEFKSFIDSNFGL